ncbi:hypothetical protein LRR18_15710 [Mangrovimonas sp. AS39]|uniref:hypothetical protein n=1 Tax=Mangrovimonas futianensis TaxID=2895523 RepID=UPI001E48E539|nr:hypothetical protein [Mangrovimonas futianensis]MCF1193040.1 hypothetical protein [Mangrovimonas futianensis]MCF1196731.1 hypothetical protein [Mangrovimonas futianensis]
MKHVSIVIILTMISHTSFGQNINGKWILKEMHSGNGQKGNPGFQLLDINNDRVDVYTDFSLQAKATTLKMDQGNLLNQDNDKTSTYEIVSDNHLKWFVPGKVNGTEAVFECDFYRLEPTVTTLKKEEIEKLTFVLMENGRASEFVFNKELWDKESLERFKRTEGEKKMIEQIDSTFFVSMYYNGKRSGSIPIKEVNTEYLKLYAIPTGPMELTAYRKE